jgi:hypothetical protein
MERPGPHARWSATAAAVLVLAVLAWCLRSGPKGAVEVGPTAPMPQETHGFGAAAPRDPRRWEYHGPTPEEAAERLRLEAASIRVIAEATGRPFVSCPPLPVARPLAALGVLVGPWKAFDMDAEGVWLAPDQPEGSALVDTSSGADAPPAVILRWRTEADGSTACTYEEPRPHAVRLRVVDREGRPVEGASVYSTIAAGSPTTGADGRASLLVYADGPALFGANTRWAASEEIWIDPRDEVTLVLERLAPPGAVHVMADHSQRYYADRQRDLEAALATPDLPDDVAAVLAEWEADLPEFDGEPSDSEP